MVKCYFNLADKIILDSIESLSVVQTELPVIVGGLAVQIDAKGDKRNLRRTPDMDILTPENISFEVFMSRVYPRVREFLGDNNYQVQVKRGRGNHAVKVMTNQNKKDSETFFIHWTHFSEDIYDKFRDYVERQITYARDERLQPDGHVFKVVSLEELLPLKIQRALKFSRDREDVVGPFYNLLVGEAERGKWESLSRIPLPEWRKKVDSMQESLGDSANPVSDLAQISETYKLNKDLYDICLSARVISNGLYSFDRESFRENIRRIIFRRTPSTREDNF